MKKSAQSEALGVVLLVWPNWACTRATSIMLLPPPPTLSERRHRRLASSAIAAQLRIYCDGLCFGLAPIFSFARTTLAEPMRVAFVQPFVIALHALVTGA